jgi:hypothetical protein
MDHKARTIEHLQSQGRDIARRSSVPKRGEGAAPIHPGMTSVTRDYGVIGGPTPVSGPDASSANVTDPTRQGKSFDIPKLAMGHKSDPQRATYDPGLAHTIMNEAKRSPDDFARSLHTKLPQTVSEEDCADG